jgi:hypothetical protein
MKITPYGGVRPLFEPRPLALRSFSAMNYPCQAELQQLWLIEGRYDGSDACVGVLIKAIERDAALA